MDGDEQRIVEVIESNGGSVRNVFDGYIEAYVPVSALAALAQAGGVTWARELARPEKTWGNITSGGVAEHLANAWHAEGIKGQGVKVGVIDSPTGNTGKDGFSGLKALMGAEAPATVTGPCFTDLGKSTKNLANCTASGGDYHGTMVAETVMDVAPAPASTFQTRLRGATCGRLRNGCTSKALRSLSIQ